MKELKFKEALKKLEKIVSDLESGDLSLEDMLGRYEEGVSLSNFCSKKLNQAKKKVKILTQKQGEFKTEDFTKEADLSDEDE